MPAAWLVWVSSTKIVKRHRNVRRFADQSAKAEAACHQPKKRQPDARAFEKDDIGTGTNKSVPAAVTPCPRNFQSAREGMVMRPVTNRNDARSRDHSQNVIGRSSPPEGKDRGDRRQNDAVAHELYFNAERFARIAHLQEHIASVA